jgi:uncharacterized membrane protein
MKVISTFIEANSMRWKFFLLMFIFTAKTAKLSKKRARKKKQQECYSKYNKETQKSN